MLCQASRIRPMTVCTAKLVMRVKENQQMITATAP
jgi:hypothetical protein